MSHHAAITAIEYYLPDFVLDNEELSRVFPEWSSSKIWSKTGIKTRHIASNQQTSLDLGVQAAQTLFERSSVRPDQVDFLLFCTQSPDFFLPTTACLAQQRLGLSKHSGALDFNLGCSGFVYGLMLAKSMIDSGSAQTVLLVTAETYSKYIDSSDRTNRTIFGDGAAATLIQRCDFQQDKDSESIGPFVLGTDGSGSENLIVRQGGMRSITLASDISTSNSTTDSPLLYMNGPEIFNFSIQTVPACIEALLKKANRILEDIDLFVFHQANSYMLEHLRRKIGIPKEKFVVEMADAGNTVSSTIPIALFEAERKGQLLEGMNVMLVGFGVGYSWGATLIKWRGYNK